MMKKILLISAALLLVCGSLFAQSGKSIYRKYSSKKDVEAVFISPGLFRIFRRIPSVDVQGKAVNLSAILQSLEGLYILSSDNPEVNGKLASETEHFIGSGRYEMLLERKEDEDATRIYTVGNDRIVKSFVLVTVRPDQTVFVCLDGRMKRSDLEALFAEEE